MKTMSRWFLSITVVLVSVVASVERAQAQLYVSANAWDGHNVPEIYSVSNTGAATLFASSGFDNGTIGAMTYYQGNIYAEITGNSGYWVDKIDSTGAVSTYFTGTTTGVSISALSFDSSGSLYIAQQGVYEGSTGSILKVTSGGDSSVFFAPTEDNVVGLAIDSSGNVYVSDGAYGATGDVYKVTSSGDSSVFVDSLYAGALTIDGDNNLYASTGAFPGEITQITPGGSTSTYSPNLTMPGNLGVDSSGNVYALAVDGSFNSIVAVIPIGGGSDSTLSTLPTYSIGLAVGAQGPLGPPSAAPEPSSYALGLIVLGVLGVAIYRRQMA